MAKVLHRAYRCYHFYKDAAHGEERSGPVDEGVFVRDRAQTAALLGA